MERMSNYSANAYKGVIMGMNIAKTWEYFFIQNELEHLPDASIASAMKREFPHHQTKSFDSVETFRSRFNRSKLYNGQKPKFQSRKFEDDGSRFKFKYELTAEEALDRIVKREIKTKIKIKRRKKK